MRFLTTWEAVEHAGSGIYDQEYFDYLYAVVKKAGEYPNGYRVEVSDGTYTSDQPNQLLMYHHPAGLEIHTIVVKALADYLFRGNERGTNQTH